MSRRPVPKSLVLFFPVVDTNKPKRARIGGDLSFTFCMKGIRQERSHNAAKVPGKDMHGVFGNMLFPVANLPHLKRKTMWIAIEDITTLFLKTAKKAEGGRKKWRVYSEHRLFRHAWHFVSFEHFRLGFKTHVLNHWDFDWDAVDVLKNALCIHRRCLTATIHGSWKWRWVYPSSISQRFHTQKYRSSKRC